MFLSLISNYLEPIKNVIHTKKHLNNILECYEFVQCQNSAHNIGKQLALQVYEYVIELVYL